MLGCAGGITPNQAPRTLYGGREPPHPRFHRGIVGGRATSADEVRPGVSGSLGVSIHEHTIRQQKTSAQSCDTDSSPSTSTARPRAVPAPPAGLAERCQEPPTMTPVCLLGAYRLSDLRETRRDRPPSSERRTQRPATRHDHRRQHPTPPQIPKRRQLGGRAHRRTSGRELRSSGHSRIRPAPVR